MPELGRSIPESCRVVPFAEADDVSAADVLDFWQREGAVDPAVAKKRINQVLLIAQHVDDGLVGVSTTYLVHNDQLGLDFWHFRVFVTPQHRTSNLAAVLAQEALRLLQERFVNGEDVRGSGIAYVVENEGLQRRFPQAVWIDRSEYVATFIGETPRGHRVSVRYFPGAEAPPPPVR